MTKLDVDIEKKMCTKIKVNRQDPWTKKKKSNNNNSGLKKVYCLARTQKHNPKPIQTQRINLVKYFPFYLDLTGEVYTC